MNYNMKEWFSSLLKENHKKPFPILSFPAISLLGITVEELISDENMQAKAMVRVAEECDSLASVNMMDLSVEAEAFGAEIRVSKDEVPTVVGRIVETEEDADNLKIPSLDAGRCMRYVKAVGMASERITDRPVFSGAIGPFSLAGRLMDMTEIMVNCLIEPDMVHKTLEKTTEFIITYMKAFRENGANGVVLAEPVAGLLSPDLNAEFSVPYVKKIVDAVQTDEFAVVYHNCGNTVPLLDDILTLGASAYHFGNAIDMMDVLPKVDKNIIVMGNVDPAGEFRGGTPDSIREKTIALLEKCTPNHPNFVLSSGCDIPPLTPWENIHAFFKASEEYYQK